MDQAVLVVTLDPPQVVMEHFPFSSISAVACTRLLGNHIFKLSTEIDLLIWYFICRF